MLCSNGRLSAMHIAWVPIPWVPVPWVPVLWVPMPFDFQVLDEEARLSVPLMCRRHATCVHARQSGSGLRCWQVLRDGGCQRGALAIRCAPDMVALVLAPSGQSIKRP